MESVRRRSRWTPRRPPSRRPLGKIERRTLRRELHALPATLAGIEKKDDLTQSRGPSGVLSTERLGMVRVYCAHGDSMLLTAFYLWASVPRGAAFPLCKPSCVRARNDMRPSVGRGFHVIRPYICWAESGDGPSLQTRT
eukprot:3206993-Prymnesium_polylepis.1